MKKISIVLVLLALTASVFASGARENAQMATDPGFGRINGELITVSGTLDVMDAEVVLLTDEGSFSLSAPRARMLDLESFNELYMTISGQFVDCDDCDDGYDGHIFIETAVADGEEYDFAVTSGRQGSTSDFGKASNSTSMRGNGAAEDTGRGNAAAQDQRFGNTQDSRDMKGNRSNVEDSRGRGNVQESNSDRRGRI